MIDECQLEKDIILSEFEKITEIGTLYEDIIRCFSDSIPSGWVNVEKPVYGTIGENTHESPNESWKIEENIPKQLYLRIRKPSNDANVHDIEFIEINAGQFGAYGIICGSGKFDRSSGEFKPSTTLVNTRHALERAKQIRRELPQQVSSQ